jgi:hypothetical protein
VAGGHQAGRAEGVERVFTSGMMVTTSPSNCGSLASLFLLCVANRSVAICSAVSSAALKVSRLWSW